MDPSTGKDRGVEMQIEQLKEYRNKLGTQALESQLLLQLFLDCKEQIKKPAFDEMAKQISNVHAKNPMATEGQVLKGLDETAVQDQEKLKRIVDYDIQPEIELRLHALIKEINQALNDIKKEQEQVDPSVSEEPVQELDVVQKTQQLKAECS